MPFSIDRGRELPTSNFRAQGRLSQLIAGSCLILFEASFSAVYSFPQPSQLSQPLSGDVFYGQSLS
eukprot:2424339-Heterocapsa_arctica.AAC.1